MKITKFKKWMNFNPARSGDADYWVAHEVSFKKEAPIRYFIMRGAFHNVVNYIKYKTQHIFEKFVYNFICKYHIVDSGLKPGYHDECELILHVNFNILVDFVEITSALKSAKKEDFKTILGIKRFLPWFIVRDSFRSRSIGISHLEWETTLIDESPNQAEAAKQILDLYIWWKDIRPSRVEIDSPRFFNYNKVHVLTTLSNKWRTENPEEYSEWKRWADASNKQDQEWSDEDQVMLQRVIAIRRSLW